MRGTAKAVLERWVPLLESEIRRLGDMQNTHHRKQVDAEFLDIPRAIEGYQSILQELKSVWIVDLNNNEGAYPYKYDEKSSEKTDGKYKKNNVLLGSGAIPKKYIKN